MLRKFSHARSLADNIRLGALTAFTAGMVNVAALGLFFSFVSNVTGHFAILAEEIASGRWFQVLVVFLWIGLFFAGSFLSNSIVLCRSGKRAYLLHALPLMLELLCLVAVGIYGVNWYRETLTETEVLTAILLFAMGLQNGLTASISNFAIKTTHLTGVTTDLAIHLSMLLRRRYRHNRSVRDKIRLLSAIAGAYLAGGITAGSITIYFGFSVFFYIAGMMLVILVVDWATTYGPVLRYHRRKKRLTAPVQRVRQPKGGRKVGASGAAS